MVLGKLIGWLLIALALGFAAAETGAQGIARVNGFMSAYDVLHTLSPGELIQTRIFIERNLHPVLWDPIIRSILWLPGWLILGVPGIIIAWKSRDRSAEEMDGEDELAVSSYDDIVAAAEEFDEIVHDEADSSPSKYGHLTDFDPTVDQHADENLAALKVDSNGKKR